MKIYSKLGPINHLRARGLMQKLSDIDDPLSCLLISGREQSGKSICVRWFASHQSPSEVAIYISLSANTKPPSLVGQLARKLKEHDVPTSIYEAKEAAIDSKVSVAVVAGVNISAATNIDIEAATMNREQAAYALLNALFEDVANAGRTIYFCFDKIHQSDSDTAKFIETEIIQRIPLSNLRVLISGRHLSEMEQTCGTYLDIGLSAHVELLPIHSVSEILPFLDEVTLRLGADEIDSWVSSQIEMFEGKSHLIAAAVFAIIVEE